MKTKDLICGQKYKLSVSNKSIEGCSSIYFKYFIGKEVKIIKKLNNFNNKNTIKIEGIYETETGYELISFWCSPYDLTEI